MQKEQVFEIIDGEHETTYAEIILSKKNIKKLIPHRWPMLLLEKAHWSEQMRNIILTEKKIRYWDLFLWGHFPGRKVYPGMLLVEAIAQSAALLVKQQDPEINNLPMFREVSDAKFLLPVVPGDSILIKTELLKFKKSRLYIFCGTINNQRGETICQVGELKGVPAL